MVDLNKFFTRNAIILYLVILSLCGIGLYFIWTETFINKFSFVVNVISLVLFFITINQLISLKEIEEKNRKVIDDKLRKYSRTIIFQDFTQKIHLVDTTQEYILINDWPSALKGIKEIIKLVDYLEIINKDYELEINEKSIDAFRRNLNLHASSIEGKIQFSKAELTIEPINKTLRTLGSLISKQSLKIKSSLI